MDRFDSEHTSKMAGELGKLKCTPEDFAKFAQERAAADGRLSDYLNRYLAGHPEFTVPGVNRAALGNLNYTNHIFSGRRQHPDKYRLVPLCIAMGMSRKETDRALFLADQPKLYEKKDLDAALILCINHQIRNMSAVLDFLDRCHLSYPIDLQR